jgi:hypothetical protein
VPLVGCIGIARVECGWSGARGVLHLLLTQLRRPAQASTRAS